MARIQTAFRLTLEVKLLVKKSAKAQNRSESNLVESLIMQDAAKHKISVTPAEIEAAKREKIIK